VRHCGRRKYVKQRVYDSGDALNPSNPNASAVRCAATASPYSGADGGARRCPVTLVVTIRCGSECAPWMCFCSIWMCFCSTYAARRPDTLDIYVAASVTRRDRRRYAYAHDGDGERGGERIVS
jgi:hypothetical protein